jgi:RNase P/RNase MRP subunit p30
VCWVLCAGCEIVRRERSMSKGKESFRSRPNWDRGNVADAELVQKMVWGDQTALSYTVDGQTKLITNQLRDAILTVQKYSRTFIVKKNYQRKRMATVRSVKSKIHLII